MDNKILCGCYEIEDESYSESALLLFTRSMTTGENVVMKVLREIKDERFSFKTRKDRQKCLLEGLEWNRKFTSDVYLGLGRICDLGPYHVCIDQIVNTPTETQLDPDADYALLMKRLPDAKRLDNLVNKEVGDARRLLVHTLLDYIVHMHKHVAKPVQLDTGGVQWGSVKQLRKKLEHNIGLLELVSTRRSDLQYRQYYWLKDALRNVLTQGRYIDYVEQRVQGQNIKRCHGDLKCSNIWITRPIQILDAVDFQPMYCNIDVLSDFAMLIIDVQVRTQSLALAQEIVEGYLELSGQQDEVSRAILTYYLVEKAIVGAAISIVYDKLPEAGLAFFRAAEMYAERLQQ